MRLAVGFLVLFTTAVAASPGPAPWTRPAEVVFPETPIVWADHLAFEQARRDFDDGDFAAALGGFERLAIQAADRTSRQRAADAAMFAFVEIGRVERLFEFVERIDRDRGLALGELAIARYANTGRHAHELAARRALAARVPPPAACEQLADAFVTALSVPEPPVDAVIAELVAALPTGSATCRMRAAERIGYYVRALDYERGCRSDDARLARLATIALHVAVDLQQRYDAARIVVALAWRDMWIARRLVERWR